MDEATAAYYRRRAEQEHALVEVASCAASRTIHASLAATYEYCIANGIQPSTRMRIALVDTQV